MSDVSVKKFEFDGGTVVKVQPVHQKNGEDVERSIDFKVDAIWEDSLMSADPFGVKRPEGMNSATKTYVNPFEVMVRLGLDNIAEFATDAKLHSVKYILKDEVSFVRFQFRTPFTEKLFGKLGSIVGSNVGTLTVAKEMDMMDMANSGGLELDHFEPFDPLDPVEPPPEETPDGITGDEPYEKDIVLTGSAIGKPDPEKIN